MPNKSSEPVCVKFDLKPDNDFYWPRPASTNGCQTAEPVAVDTSDGKQPDSKPEPLASDAKVTFSTLNAEDEARRREKKRSQLIRQCVEYLSLECSNSRLGKQNFYEAFRKKEVLSRIFQLFDRNEDGYLSQEEWVEFIKGQLLDAKQADLTEELESKAYVICGDNKVSLEKFYEIFQVKRIVDKVFRLIDKDCDGWVTPEQIMEVISALTSPRITTGFDKESLMKLEQLFRQTIGNETEIKESDFKKIVTSKNPFFTERVFRIFDKDNSGSISLQEFLDAVHQFSGQSPEDKMKFLFKVYDINGDGLIHPKELRSVIQACMEENGMRFSDEQIDDLTIALFEDADCGMQEGIDYVALKNQLERHDGFIQNLSISIDRWLVPPKPKCTDKPLMKKLLSLVPYQLTLPYIRNNYVFLTFLTIFLAVNVILFVKRAIEYSSKNAFTIFARACGQCLNFNCAFILILILRHFITYLRTRGASSFLPLDHHIYFHKITGVFILIYSFVHTITHLLNFGLCVVYDKELNDGNFTFVEWILTPKPAKFGLIDGWANPTGILLIIILILVVVCSHPLVRRRGCFEVFYWTHLLHVPFLILLVIHSQNFWKWLIVPGFGYLLEWAIGFSARTTCRGKTYISSGLLLPSKVTHLVIKRPHQFYFHPGDYVFVKIPAIANYEWHPFTISSAPEQEDYIWLHIRGVGGWTNSLYNYFEKEQEKLNQLNEHTSQNGTTQNDNGGIKRLKATLERTISGGNKSVANKATSWQKKSNYINPNFSSLPENLEIENFPYSTASDSVSTSCHELNSSNNIDQLSTSSDKKYQKLFYKRKTPLSKSRSMPDIDHCLKNKERLLTLREYSRSESEKSFNECQMKKARLRSVGLAYLNPQNKSLAHSFRYMRNKPTIIAFKTPSVELNVSCETRLKNSDLDLRAEEGRLEMKCKKPYNFQTEINYPIGKPLEIYIDGPYGAPSSHIFRAQHAVLIATGIGVTPFASILQSIMHRYWKARQTCPKCTHTWVCDIPPTVMNLRKVDFFWINRDQRSFEWFVNLLSQLEIEQAELGGAMVRFLEIHMYITSALQKTDMKAVGLQLALDLLHKKEKRDLITGLKTRTNAGRPNWDKVFKQLQDQKKGKITVFYCGQPQLGKVLRVKCDQFGFEFKKEIF